MVEPNRTGEAARGPSTQRVLIVLFIAASLAVAVVAAVWGSRWSSHVNNGTHSHAEPSNPADRM